MTVITIHHYGNQIFKFNTNHIKFTLKSSIDRKRLTHDQIADYVNEICQITKCQRDFHLTEIKIIQLKTLVNLVFHVLYYWASTTNNKIVARFLAF